MASRQNTAQWIHLRKKNGAFDAASSMIDTMKRKLSHNNQPLNGFWTDVRAHDSDD